MSDQGRHFLAAYDLETNTLESQFAELFPGSLSIGSRFSFDGLDRVVVLSGEYTSDPYSTTQRLLDFDLTTGELLRVITETSCTGPCYDHFDFDAVVTVDIPEPAAVAILVVACLQLLAHTIRHR